MIAKLIFDDAGNAIFNIPLLLQFISNKIDIIKDNRIEFDLLDPYNDIDKSLKNSSFWLLSNKDVIKRLKQNGVKIFIEIILNDNDNVFLSADAMRIFHFCNIDIKINNQHKSNWLALADAKRS